MASNPQLVSVYRGIYEKVVRVTNNVVSRCKTHGVTVALSLLANPTIDEIAKQIKVFADLLEWMDGSGLLDGDDVMMSVNARAYATALSRIAEAFSRQDEAEVKRLVQQLDGGSIL